MRDLPVSAVALQACDPLPSHEHDGQTGSRASGCLKPMVKPRREPRHVVPAVSFHIQVNFHTETELYVGRLWDISDAGACLMFPSHHRGARVGCNAMLEMFHPNIAEPIRASGEVLWIDDLEHAIFLGLIFHEPIDLEQTFLRMLKGRSSGNAPTDRLRSLRDNDGGSEAFDP